MRLNLRLRKIIRDLWGNKTRSLLVILTIAIGGTTVASISRTWAILSQELSDVYLEIKPASAYLFTANQSFGDNLLDSIRKMPEVAEAEGVRSVQLRMLAGSDKWDALKLVTLPDYEDNRINQLGLEQGVFPPDSKTILLERSSLGILDSRIGDTLIIQTPQGKERKLIFSGIVHHLHQLPSSTSLIPFGYVSADTFEQLTNQRGFNELEIIVTENQLDKEHITQVTDLVSDKVRKSGFIITDKLIPAPGKPLLDGGIQAALLILWALSILALLLSMMLVINTISALLSQQVQQIGTLKALGAETRHIITMYAAAVIIFGTFAWLIAVPVGTIAGRALATNVANLINFDLYSFNIPWWVFVLDIFACLIMPLIAALYP